MKWTFKEAAAAARSIHVEPCCPSELMPQACDCDAAVLATFVDELFGDKGPRPHRVEARLDEETLGMPNGPLVEILGRDGYRAAALSPAQARRFAADLLRVCDEADQRDAEARSRDGGPF